MFLVLLFLCSVHGGCIVELPVEAMGDDGEVVRLEEFQIPTMISNEASVEWGVETQGVCYCIGLGSYKRETKVNYCDVPYNYYLDQHNLF